MLDENITNNRLCLEKNRLLTIYYNIIDYVLRSFSIIINYLQYKTKPMLTSDQTTTVKLTPYYYEALRTSPSTVYQFTSL